MAKDFVDSAVARVRVEQDDPSLSARVLEPLTGMLFFEAGLEFGMHVLDVCSGLGDVAFVAREIVGANGLVTGFDCVPATVNQANERAALRGLGNVRFVEAGIEKLPFGRDFDAIVGRLVLMYRRDPARDLRALLRCLRPGGLVVFQEFDMLPGKTVPPAEVVDGVRAWVLDAFERAGIELEMGPKLYATFTAAGLDPPQMRIDGIIGGAESVAPALVANVARMLLPQAEALGVVSSDDLHIETLEGRMRADLARTGGVMSTPLLIGAWARLAGG